MNWTLLVPGALLPPRLAPELARAMRAPALVQQLALVRPLPPQVPSGAAHDPPAGYATEAAHWAWLARNFGLDAGSLASAPYAWRAAGGADACGAVQGAVRGELRDDSKDDGHDDEAWIAHCDPVHLAIARDHFVVTDLGEAPLSAAETDELLAYANAVLAAEPGGAPLRLCVRGGRWFLRSPAPLHLKTWSLDAVLGQSVQDRMPVDTGAGGAARRWRVLGNEIQMSWHTSRANAAREEAGQRTANALWLHGGGRWRRLDGLAPRTLRVDPDSAEAATVRGWLQAAGRETPDAPPPGADTLAICRELFHPYAHQAWETWLERLAVVDARIDAELQAARAAGARRFELVLCGAARSRRIELPLQAPWWRRLRAHAHPPALLLQRWLTESAAGGEAAGALAA